MTLTTGISSRLTRSGRWTSSDGRAVAEVAETGRTDDRGAPRYEWTLKVDKTILARAEDLCGWDATFKEVLHTLSSFLGAWQEAQRYPHSENRDIFPPECEPFLDYIEEFEMDTYPEEDE